LFAYFFIKDYYEKKYGAPYISTLLRSPLGFAMMNEDLKKFDNEQVADSVAVATRETVRSLDGEQWGDRHFVRIGHLLSNIPLIGSYFPSREYADGGNASTIKKTAAGLTERKHRSTFGAVARHLSDMGDPDENYFVIAGGQDAWIGSENNFDQVSLWQENELIKMPLTQSAREESYPISITLKAHEPRTP